MIDYSLDRVERSQISALSEVAKAARAESTRLGDIVARTGLSAATLAPAPVKGGVGGPLIPLDVDNAAPAFDKAAAAAARQLEAAERLRKLMPFLPIREPLVGDSGVSSPFGYRTDPFIGRPALHPGIDLVQAYGADIKATAAGKVVRAGPMGGYGNMVEIDHGNGIATRYGHMSEVLVEEGDVVKAGDVLGRIGSTGRSTGPHLHYEVRVDGEPVDPERFRQAVQPRLASQ
jgi:murein DD-endopeptidase MepM/ murein hydrolase activator NlpD